MLGDIISVPRQSSQNVGTFWAQSAEIKMMTNDQCDAFSQVKPSQRV